LKRTNKGRQRRLRRKREGHLTNHTKKKMHHRPSPPVIGLGRKLPDQPDRSRTPPQAVEGKKYVQLAPSPPRVPLVSKKKRESRRPSEKTADRCGCRNFFLSPRSQDRRLGERADRKYQKEKKKTKTHELERGKSSYTAPNPSLKRPPARRGSNHLGLSPRKPVPPQNWEGRCHQEKRKGGLEPRSKMPPQQRGATRAWGWPERRRGSWGVVGVRKITSHFGESRGAWCKQATQPGSSQRYLLHVKTCNAKEI